VDDHAFNYLSVSPYAYVGNNPLVLTDPDGRDWYRHDESEKLIWYPGSDPREGYTYVGENIWMEGESHFFFYRQNELERKFSKTEYDRQGVIFYMFGGRSQETRRGYGDYVDAGQILTAASAVSAAGRARPINSFGQIMTKFGNFMAAWEVGNELGNSFNLQIEEVVPEFSFTSQAAYKQLHSSTIRRMREQIMRSDEFHRLREFIGLDTINSTKGDTILPWSYKREPGERTLTPLSPRLND
jgi:hypothetical protein